MKKATRSILTLICICWIVQYSQAQVNQSNGIGIEFGYNGHVLDQTSPLKFVDVGGNYRYSSKALVMSHLESDNLSRLTDYVSPFSSRSLSVTKTWPSTVSLRSVWIGKVGINVVSQLSRLEFQTDSSDGGNAKAESVSLTYKENTTMVGLSLERKYFMLEPSSKFNFFLAAGVDAGLGISSKLSVKGSIEEYYVENFQMTNKVTKNIDEIGTGTNAFYYGCHVAAGPQYSLKGVTFYAAFNVVLAKLRKVNANSFDVLNSGVTIGLKF